MGARQVSVSGHGFELHSKSELRTQRLGHALAEELRAGDVVALIGPLGAGKTQMVRGVATGLGVSESLISSPTFVLMNEYPGRLPVVHIDAYRLSDIDELETIGWSPELLEDAVTLIEWADRMEADLPADHLRIELEHVGEHERELQLTGFGEWADRLDGLRQRLEAALRTVACPVCGKQVGQEISTYPFCSDRCRLVDLNKWFDGEYRISRPIEEQDLDDQL